MRFQNRIELLTLRWRQIAICDGSNSHVPWAAPSACVANRECDQDNGEQAGDGWFHSRNIRNLKLVHGKLEDAILVPRAAKKKEITGLRENRLLGLIAVSLV
jgi:hypothetical protein